MQGSSMMESFWSAMNGAFAQSAAMGALPTEYAAAAPEVHGADYIGPDGFGEMWGHPAKVGCSASAKDAVVASKLWDESEKLTGVNYSFAK